MVRHRAPGPGAIILIFCAFVIVFFLLALWEFAS